MCITTRIEVKPYLKEYLLGKFCAAEEQPVRFPDKIDIYHLIWDLLEKRPVNAPIDRGNLEIVLPHRTDGKSPFVYNYLGIRSQKRIEQRITIMMWSELHYFLDFNKHKLGVNYINSIHYFMRKYSIDSLSEDAFLKNFYRWRGEMRRKAKKRCFRQ